jgi:hypothetical protein
MINTAGYPQLMRASLAVLITIWLATGCSGPPATDAQLSEEKDRQEAEERLQQMVAEKRASQEREEAQRAQQLEAEERARRETEKPHYPPDVLRAAARPRTWARITVPDLNISCVFNSTWTNGNLNYRVAMLGQRWAITNFLSQWAKYKVNFADQAGNNIYEFEVNASDFQWEPDSYNGGIPTMDTRGKVEMPLELYENAVQWNLTWHS